MESCPALTLYKLSTALLSYCFKIFFFPISLGKIAHSFNYSQFLRSNFETQKKDTGVLLCF